jgi:G3E family GTPase
MTDPTTRQTAKIPVTILTGFLGSGKTTLLNRLLRSPEFASTIVIVNEFGEVGLDHLLIETSEEVFTLLDNGCVCCTVRGDLVETLTRLARWRGVGEIPPFARVVLETTGLADPAPILHSLMVDAELVRDYRIDGVLVTVDAANAAQTLDAYPEAVKQVAVADRLLLTKRDLIGEAEALALEARLNRLNPGAPLIEARCGRIDPAMVLDLGQDPGMKDGEVAAWLRDEALAAAEAHGAHGHHHDHGRHDAAIQSYALVIDEPVEWGPFSAWLELVAAMRGDSLLRFKGIVHLADDSKRPLVVHGVQHVFHPPIRLDTWPSEDRSTRLVFIVRDIPRSVIESTLSKFARIAPSRIAPAGTRKAALVA